MPYIEEAGTFRGEIVAYGAEEKDSGSVAVKIEVLISDHFSNGVWNDWSEHNMIATGRVWLIGKTGKIIKRNAEALMNYAAWDGTFKSITDGNWEPDKVGITVKGEEYPEGSGKIFYRIEWINPFEKKSHAGNGSFSAEQSNALDSKFGSQLRGLASIAKPSPVNKPPAKPSKAEDSDIPF